VCCEFIAVSLEAVAVTGALAARVYILLHIVDCVAHFLADFRIQAFVILEVNLLEVFECRKIHFYFCQLVALEVDGSQIRIVAKQSITVKLVNHVAREENEL
jgi:hypothetical protein